MIVVDNIKGVRDLVASHRAQGRTIAFVPTMGNLHAGHLALIAAARELGDTVLVSLYVNPLQFGVGEDLATYPRTLEEDGAVLREQQVDALFMPNDKTMYPRGLEHQTKVTVPDLGAILEGETRPVFFEGVTTVVARLFNIVAPDIAAFGKKDYQQMVVIKRMVDDLAMPIDIIGVETVRDDDGLALSSRNNYLTEKQRSIAPGLYQALEAGRQRVLSGEKDYPRIEEGVRDQLSAAGIKSDYVALRRQSDLAVAGAQDRALVILGAGYVGSTRLIDNIELEL